MPTEKRERQRANREAKLAAQQKQDRKQRTRRTIIRYSVIAVIVLAVLFVISLRGGDDEPADTTLATTDDSPADDAATEFGPADYAGFRAQTTACGGTAPSEAETLTFDAPQDQGLTGPVTAVVTTSCGDIEIALDPELAPESVNSFVFLAREGYFDGTACHRFLDGFVLQCGDPTATGSGDPGYSLADEFPEAGFAYERGVVAMANAGPGTTGSQFFIVTGDATALGPEFTVLGNVVASEDTLAALDDVPRGLQPNGEPSAPLESIYIEGVTIEG